VAFSRRFPVQSISGGVRSTRAVALAVNRLCRDEEVTLAWDHFNHFPGFVFGGRVAKMESQPFLGLRSERRVGIGSHYCCYFAAARPDLADCSKRRRLQACCDSEAGNPLQTLAP
jgi:hypothetical protein